MLSDRKRSSVTILHVSDNYLGVGPLAFCKGKDVAMPHTGVQSLHPLHRTTNMLEVSMMAEDPY